jgi:hypothetical protein
MPSRLHPDVALQQTLRDAGWSPGAALPDAPVA